MDSHATPGEKWTIWSRMTQKLLLSGSCGVQQWCFPMCCFFTKLAAECKFIFNTKQMLMCKWNMFQLSLSAIKTAIGSSAILCVFRKLFYSFVKVQQISQNIYISVHHSAKLSVSGFWLCLQIKVFSYLIIWLVLSDLLQWWNTICTTTLTSYFPKKVFCVKLWHYLCSLSLCIFLAFCWSCSNFLYVAEGVPKSDKTVNVTEFVLSASHQKEDLIYRSSFDAFGQLKFK